MERWVDTAGRSIRDVCDEFFDAVPVPDPFTLHDFVASVGALVGRRLEAVATTPGATMSCGGLISTPDMTLIWYPDNTGVLHQGHVVLHELAHVVCGHRGQPLTLSADDDRVLAALQRLMPDVPIERIRRVLHRSGYEGQAEQQAELFATIAGPRLHRLIATSRMATRQDGDIRRLQPLFALPPQG